VYVFHKLKECDSLELTYIVLLILAIIYVPFYLWVRFSPNAAKYGLVKYGPTVMIKTKLGTKLMEKWCIYTRFWRFFGTLSLVISAVLMIGIIFIMIVGMTNLASNLSAPGIGIEYALAIPGLNPILPIWYGIIGLFVAMIIHELAHGMQTRSNNMRVESTGLLYGVVPLGAFVEPNEEDVEKSTRRVKLDLYSAGISTNFIGAVVAFFLFAILMMGGISSSYGDNAAVYSMTGNSPAYEAGIPSGAIILEVDGHPYVYSDDYTFEDYSWKPGEPVTITYLTEDGERTTDKLVKWGLYIESITSSSPAEKAGLKPKMFILSIGIYVEGSVETYQMYGAPEFRSFINNTTPNTKTVITYAELVGESWVENVIDVELSSKNGVGFLGVGTTTSGMNFMTPSMVLDKARNPINGADSVTSAATSIMAYIGGPFQGFSPLPESVQWWYDVPLEDLFWIIVSILYWIFWFNIMLGVSNAIPAYPFDGGFIFLGGLNGLLEKLGIKDRERREKISSSVTGYVSMIMIFMFVLMIASVVF
jgi:Predicted membrane-associated Zn-dependent proteases 1